MSDIAPYICPFLVAALKDERRERHRQRQLTFSLRYMMVAMTTVNASERHCERLIRMKIGPNIFRDEMKQLEMCAVR